MLCEKTLKKGARNSHLSWSVKKGALIKKFAKFTGKHLYHKFFNLIEKETLTQVFSCEFCKILKSTLFYIIVPPVDASEGILKTNFWKFQRDFRNRSLEKFTTRYFFALNACNFNGFSEKVLAEEIWRVCIVDTENIHFKINQKCSSWFFNFKRSFVLS